MRFDSKTRGWILASGKEAARHRKNVSEIRHKTGKYLYGSEYVSVYSIG